MKKACLILAVMLAIGITGYTAADDVNCNTVKHKTVQYLEPWYLAGEFMSPGFDVFGYNYQAHLFNGYYPNYYYNKIGLPPYEGDEDTYIARLVAEDLYEKWSTTSIAQTLWNDRNVMLVMKWNDAWLSNKDCNANVVSGSYLDRPSSYIGSGAWETNHQSGTYMGEDGKEHHWNYFVKIIAVPSDADLVEGVWFRADGVEIGPVIWGSFAIIQQVDNDPYGGYCGISYRSPAGPGFGKF